LQTAIKTLVAKSQDTKLEGQNSMSSDPTGSGSQLKICWNSTQLLT